MAKRKFTFADKEISALLTVIDIELTHMKNNAVPETKNRNKHIRIILTI